MKKTIILIIILSFNIVLTAQPFASWTNETLILNNGVVERTIQLPATNGNFITIQYKPLHGNFNYFDQTSPDFQFEVNDIVYSGRSNWQLKGIKKYADTLHGDGAAVTLLSDDKKLEVTLQFLLYPTLPVIRKSLLIKNLTADDAVLQSVDIERFDAANYFPTTFSWICHDYGRRRCIGPYNGDMQDALIIIHNSDVQQGIVIGNEAPGVIKHTSVFWQGKNICAGLTHKDDRFPFKKYIEAHDSFQTPQVFSMLYNKYKDPYEILNNEVNEFVNTYLGTRLSVLQQKPTFVYNTWIPFHADINEKLVMELAKAAADAGMKEFIIDDGWQSNYGDWEIDKNKFPNGLKPVFDYIKSLGMKPGLWVSIGSASPQSNVFKAHPNWFTVDAAGKYMNLHSADTSIRTACFGTGWYAYIRNILLKLAVDYGLEYLKLDLTIVKSAYIFDDKITGCYALDHPRHKDHDESLFTNYEALWKLFDELHAAKPELFIDCTFETMGGLQLIDYAMLKHAEGDWLSNFEGPTENTDLRIRNMSWWRSPAMPAAALVIGNPQMQDSGWQLHIKSQAGSLPIMLGDPRKLSAADLKKYRSYADWLQLMDKRYSIMSYRQDMSCFGEPQQGMWDGFQRINTATKQGGIIGVFRHGAAEIKRLVTVQYLNPNKTYYIKNMHAKTIASKTGKQLSKQGFEVVIDKLYDGELFEISEAR